MTDLCIFQHPDADDSRAGGAAVPLPLAARLHPPAAPGHVGGVRSPHALAGGHHAVPPPQGPELGAGRCKCSWRLASLLIGWWCGALTAEWSEENAHMHPHTF